MKILALALLVVSISLSSCKSDDVGLDPSATALLGVDWTLVALSVDGTPMAFSTEEPAPTLRFESSSNLVQVAGFAGVNRYSGTCTLAGGSLSFPPMLTTRMAGPPERMQLELAFLLQLQDAGSYVLEDGQLTILSDRGSLRFRAE